MNRLQTIQDQQKKLNAEYKILVERAYNLGQTDSALRDISEYKAIKLLNRLNKLKYFYREQRKA